MKRRIRYASKDYRFTDLERSGESVGSQWYAWFLWRLCYVGLKGGAWTTMAATTAQRTLYETHGFRMGTLGCPCCGHAFPLSTNGATQSSRCARCGIVVFPDAKLRDADLVFSAADLQLTSTAAVTSLKSGKDTEDQRATEQAHCEKCKEMRKCFVFAQQTRGADEGQTIFFECSVCANQWSLNS